MASVPGLVFAGKAVATASISFLVNKAFTYLIEYRQADGVDEMKRRILLALPRIQAVFQVSNPEFNKGETSALDAWLWQLRDAVEEAEDTLDEIEYYELQKKAKDRKVSDWGTSFSKLKHKASKSVQNSSIVDKAIKGLTHHGILKRLRKAFEGLDMAAAGVADFLALVDHLRCHTGVPESLNRGRETGSMLAAPEVFGRHTEREIIVGWLTKQIDESTEIAVSSDHVSVVSIVGHGGMGKTTLAQLVCDAVKNQFNKVIWVCVSTSFDATTIISKILESATWATPNAKTLDALQKILKTKLGSIKFLLVLDDVWDDKNIEQWNNLFAPLRKGKIGSKILLTTRMQSVADLARDSIGWGQNECLPLQSLKEDENIKLFNHHAFPFSTFQDYNALRPIGEQIATNVRGCPLVTKVVASHLRDNLTFQYWNNFLHQRLKHFEGSADDIMNVLRLSYYHLPTELQACFRYCSIFPQNYAFSKDELVEMWMSSGAIPQDAVESQSSLVDTGEQYLAQLTRKSFFDLRFKVDHHGQLEEESARYVMHDLIHDLARYASSGECARITDIGSLENVVRTVRHMWIEGISNFPVEKIKENSHLENLRTVIIKNEYKKGQLNNKDILNATEELVQNTKSLRIFQTELCHTSHFLGNLAKLKHLRSLKLTQLSPESICEIVKLYHLRTVHCSSVKIEHKQLRDVGNLDQLRYVTYGSFGFGTFPVGRLIFLRELENYHIQGVKGYTISALKELRSLRRLDVQGLCNVSDHEEAKEANLKEKQYLESLSLGWPECNGDRCRSDELILDNLEPHANLKKLCIVGFGGTRMSYWMEGSYIKNLVRLELERCRCCIQLPTLEKLETLKYLCLYDLIRLKKFIPELTNFSGDECTGLFLPPNLRTLEVKFCPELGDLPHLPPSLVSLLIEHVGLTKLPRIGKRHDSNVEIASSHMLDIIVKSCPCLTSLDGSLFEQKHYIAALRAVHIINCIQLESASVPFEVMNRLGEINISSCPKLRTPRGTEDKVLPSSLWRLKMGQCGELELVMLGSMHGLTNLSVLKLQNCSVVVSLPSADVFKSLKSLQHMEISRCRNLSSLGGLGSHTFLNWLQITKCCKLAVAEAGLSLTWDGPTDGEEDREVVSRSSLKINHILIDLPSLLLVEPLNSLCRTKQLTIDGSESEMESIPEQWLLQNGASLETLQINQADYLESLPRMRDLTSLEALILFGVGRLRSLPNLPSALHLLFIYGCPTELENKAGEYGSSEWNKISHVQRVEIGGLFFIMGKKCSADTYEKLCNADDNALSSWASQQEDNGNGI